MSADDDNEDETGSVYARASARQAGRPAASTRAAILAEARRVAEVRRAPAANESWFRKRVAAGIAASVLVAGVAVLLWRQTGPQAVLQTKAELTAATDEDVDVSRPMATAPAFESQQAANQSAAQARSESARELATSRSASAARAAAPAAPVAERADAQMLVEREFPGLLDAAVPPRSVWLVQDARGTTLKSGTLAEGESFDSVTRRLRQELPDREIGAFEVSNVSTASGTVVQVGVARTR